MKNDFAVSGARHSRIIDTVTSAYNIDIDKLNIVFIDDTSAEEIKNSIISKNPDCNDSLINLHLAAIEYDKGVIVRFY